VTDDAASLFARVNALPVKARNRLLFDLLAAAGATGIVIPGANGEIEGYLADRTIALKYLKNKSWSIEKIALAERWFAARGGGSYIDLGANIGTTVVPIARLDRVTGHAVEPEPANFRLLALNLIRNGVADRVQAHNVAIDVAEGEAEFELAPENLGDHRLRRGAPAGNAYHERERTTTTVPTRPLDAIVPASSLREPVVVKMDIQGAEPFAFASGAAVFARTELLLTEYWPYGIRRLGGDLDALHAAFARHFRFGAVLADDQAPETVALEPIEALIACLGAVGRDQPAEAIDLVLAREPRLFDPA
jgi:FkbM family methyltransferase